MGTDFTDKRESIWESVLIGNVPCIILGSASTVTASSILYPEMADHNLSPVSYNGLSAARVDDGLTFSGPFAEVCHSWWSQVDSWGGMVMYIIHLSHKIDRI